MPGWGLAVVHWEVVNLSLVPYVPCEEMDQVDPSQGVAGDRERRPNNKTLVYISQESNLQMPIDNHSIRHCNQRLRGPGPDDKNLSCIYPKN